MKLHFETNLDYQLQAIEAVCELFRGQETCRTKFTVTFDAADNQKRLGFAENDLGSHSSSSMAAKCLVGARRLSTHSARSATERENKSSSALANLAGHPRFSPTPSFA